MNNDMGGVNSWGMAMASLQDSLFPEIVPPNETDEQRDERHRKAAPGLLDVFLDMDDAVFGEEREQRLGIPRRRKPVDTPTPETPAK